MKINKILPLLLASFITSCSSTNTSSFRRLNSVNYPDNKKTFDFIDVYQSNPLRNFSYLSGQKIMDTNSNSLYSPLSLYFALSMLSEGISSTKSLDEMNNLLGNQKNERRELLKKVFNNNYYKNDEGQCSIANSLWIAKGHEINESFCDNIASNYYGELFELDFYLKENKQKIVDWINDNTKNLLNLDLNKYYISNDIAMLLINTLYFANSWSEVFYEGNTKTDQFTLNNSQTVNADYMNHEYTSLIYESENYVACKDMLNNGNYIEYILPNESVSLDEVLNDKSIYSLTNGNEYKIDLHVPKFKYSNSLKLSDVIKSLGLSSLYEPGNLNNIANGVVVSDIKQDCAIEVDENGIKAAAATSIVVKDTMYVSELETYEFKLNRPFIYIIYSSGNIPLFIGNLVDPTK